MLKSATDQLERPDRDDGSQDEAAEGEAISLSRGKTGGDTGIEGSIGGRGSHHGQGGEGSTRGANETSHFVHFENSELMGEIAPNDPRASHGEFLALGSRRRNEPKNLSLEIALVVGAEADLSNPIRAREMLMAIKPKLNGRPLTARQRHDRTTLGRLTARFLVAELLIVEQFDFNANMRFEFVILLIHLDHP